MRVIVFICIVLLAGCGDGAPSSNQTPTNNLPNGENNADDLCEAYCERMARNCEEEYATADACLAACATFSPDGMEGDDTGDTLQCRVTHARAAGLSESPEQHCEAAAQHSTFRCVEEEPPPPLCQTYCDRMEANCTGDHAQYETRQECESACEGFDDSGAEFSSEGDTLQCRLTNANMAGAGSAAVHCPQAGPSPTEGCI